MQNVLTDEEREQCVEILRKTIESGHPADTERNLWGQLLAVCHFRSELVNQYVEEFSNFIAQGTPKTDVMDYRAVLLLKTEHHRHLLTALLDGACFRNGRLSQEISKTLFDNEERLAGVLAVSGFLSDQLLESVLQKAGSLINMPYMMEDSIEKITDLDKLFALVKEAPFCLARAISDGCQELLTQRDIANMEEEFQILKKLYALANGMLSSAEQRREHLEHYHCFNSKTLCEIRACDWMHDTSFLSMWDSLLHTATKMLVRATELEPATAKQLGHVSIYTAGRLFTTLRYIVENEVINLEAIPQRFRDVQSLADQYLCTIIACCFDKQKACMGDPDIKKEIISLAKQNCCYEAIFNLLYKYNNDGLHLVQLMVHWDPLHRKTQCNSLTYHAFSKWLENGTAKDLEFLLKGPMELDNELVGFLQDHERLDLVSLIQIRMGRVAEARNSLHLKGRCLTPEDKTLKFLLAYSDSTRSELELKDLFLELRLMNFNDEFGLGENQLEILVVLRKLLWMLHSVQLNNEQQSKLMHAVLEIFYCKGFSFVEQNREEWKQLWCIVGRTMSNSETHISFGDDEHETCYPLEHFRIVCTACQKLNLPIEEKQMMLEEMIKGLTSVSSSTDQLVSKMKKILDLPHTQF